VNMVVGKKQQLGDDHWRMVVLNGSWLMAEGLLAEVLLLEIGKLMKLVVGKVKYDQNELKME